MLCLFSVGPNLAPKGIFEGCPSRNWTHPPSVPQLCRRRCEGENQKAPGDAWFGAQLWPFAEVG